MIDFASLPLAELCDDGGKPLRARLLVTSDIATAVRDAVAANWAVMPAGGLTSAIGSFDYADARCGDFAGVVAIRAKAAAEPEILSIGIAPESVQSHQMVIDAGAGLVTVGAGLTFAQVNAALEKTLGPTARLLVDLTSVGSAAVGGVLATGGMGPMRLHPSASVEMVILADGGETPRRVSGAEVEGLQGWTGMVCAAVMRFYRVPTSEFGLVLPVQGSDVDTVASLLIWLQRWTHLELPAAGQPLACEDLLLNGIELVSLDSLQAFVAAASEPAKSKAESLIQSCDYAGANMLACLTGWSDMALDDVLFALMDPETETIGGVPIDFGVGFSSGAEMETFRAIREGAPDLARTRARVVQDGMLPPWSTSTDINVIALADSGAAVSVLTAYADYRAAIRTLAEDMAGNGITVEATAYGHLSPLGMDPHHRVTLLAKEGLPAALAASRQAVMACKRMLVRDILHACERDGGTVTGGEKGAPSLVDIVKAAGGESRLPDNLKKKLADIRRLVQAAPKAFSFRAPTVLLEGD